MGKFKVIPADVVLDRAQATVDYRTAQRVEIARIAPLREARLARDGESRKTNAGSKRGITGL